MVDHPEDPGTLRSREDLLGERLPDEVATVDGVLHLSTSDQYSSEEGERQPSLGTFLR